MSNRSLAYHIASSVFEIEYTVKKSRFIARVVPVTSREDALVAVADAKKDHPDARHYCWAYLLGEPGDARSAGMNDDGEPAGTAGKPILNVLQHGKIGDVLVVVIRYFGGVKLGAGGLARAYGTAVGQALESVPSRPKLDLQQYHVSGNFSQEQLLRHWLTTVDGKMISVKYGDQVIFQLALPTAEESALLDFCAANQLEMDDSC